MGKRETDMRFLDLFFFAESNLCPLPGTGVGGNFHYVPKGIFMILAYITGDCWVMRRFEFGFFIFCIGLGSERVDGPG
jgi:hypothetical protein